MNLLLVLKKIDWVLMNDTMDRKVLMTVLKKVDLVAKVCSLPMQRKGIPLFLHMEKLSLA